MEQWLGRELGLDDWQLEALSWESVVGSLDMGTLRFHAPEVLGTQRKHLGGCGVGSEKTVII